MFTQIERTVHMMGEMVQIIPSKKQRESTSKFSPSVKKARLLEQTRRAALARQRALTLLSKRYPDEFNEIRASEREIINQTSGSLPGDE